jgi:hypothetical protein
VPGVLGDEPVSIRKSLQIRGKAMKADLVEVFKKHGLQILEDDGMWMFLDDYTDTAKIHFRELGWADKWKQMSEYFKPVEHD